MRTVSTRFSTEVRRGGFTVTELMVAFGVGLPLAGAVVLLLLQASFEQRRGFADSTVEQSAYVLQSRITSCLRSMSCGGAFAPVDSTVVYDTDNTLLGYQTVSVFHANPTNGSLTRAQISFNPSSGQVTYTPDMSAPGSQIVWMTSGSTVALRQLCFITYQNFDTSLNNSLVTVLFEMDDNGHSQQGTTNNLADICRSFSIQMRSD